MAVGDSTTHGIASLPPGSRLVALSSLLGAVASGGEPQNQHPRTVSAPPCACADPSLCLPLQTPPPDKEVFAWAISPPSASPLGSHAGFFDYRWDLVSSVELDPTSTYSGSIREHNRTIYP